MSLETTLADLVSAITKHGELVAANTAANTATMERLAASGVTVAPQPSAPVVEPKKTKGKALAVVPDPVPVVGPEPGPAETTVEPEPAETEPEAPVAPTEIDDSDPVKLRKELQSYLKDQIVSAAGPEFKAAFAAELAKRGVTKAIDLPDSDLKEFYILAQTW